MPNQYTNTSMSTFNQSHPILWGLLKLDKGPGLGARTQEHPWPLNLEALEPNSFADSVFKKNGEFKVVRGNMGIAWGKE